MTGGALFVTRRRQTDGATVAGLWTVVAGWARAAERRFGQAWVLTPDGVVAPRDALPPFERGAGAQRHASSLRRRAPRLVRTAASDVRRARLARSFRVEAARSQFAAEAFEFVWQQQDLFALPGPDLARRFRCPLVSYVDAPQVWEAQRWGVTRPGWGRILEAVVEAPQLRKSDVVACVSDEVAREVTRLGVRPERILVSATAVDAGRFAPRADGAAVRHALGLDDSLVVGWVGTFRWFQGLDAIVDAFARVHDRNQRTRLLLVGDGNERAHVEQLVDQRRLRDAVVFAGAVNPEVVPEYLAAIDVAVLSARADHGFHYAPLKLREYLACARATIAPRVGEIPSFVCDDVHAMLYEAGNVDALAAALEALCSDPARRARLGQAGRELVMRTATWDRRLDELLDSPAFAAARRSRASTS